jgi:hypothetical protein
MIADNRLTEIATWDDRLLGEQLRDLSLSGLDFDLEVIGFQMSEIDLRIASLEDTPTVGFDPADILPEITAGSPVSKIRDLWLLGRVLCGNALEPEAFTALMGQQRAAMAFADPPYNVEIDGHASGLGAIHHRPFPMASGEMDRAEFTAFLAQALRNLAAFSAPGSLHYICMDWRHLEELLAAGGEAYGELKNLCVWVKDNAGMGRSIAASTSSSWSSNSAAARTATMSSSASLGATAAMCGVIPAPTPSPAMGRRAICWRCTRP